MNKLKKNSEAKQLNALFEAICALENKRECQRLLNDLCTPAEIRAFADRWWVAQLLHKGGISYREINDETGVAIGTITRVARFLTSGYGGYQLLLGRLDKRKKVPVK